MCKHKEKNTRAKNSKTRALFTTVKANQNHHHDKDQAVPVAVHQNSPAPDNHNKVHQLTHHSSKRKAFGAATSYQRSRKKDQRRSLLPPFCLPSLHVFSPSVGKDDTWSREGSVLLAVWYSWNKGQHGPFTDLERDCPRTKEFLMGTRGRPKETSSHGWIKACWRGGRL